ncbi:MAG: amino acid permease, partial [Polyangia bacterium]
IFVANLSNERLTGWLKEDTSRITLAHLLMSQLAGQGAARLASLFVVLSLMSSVISMTLVGPRVSAAMADEGFLPRALSSKMGRPPLGAVLLQSGVALALLATHSFEELLRSVGAILTVTSGLTVMSLLRLRFGRTTLERPSLFVMACALVYVAGAAWMLWFSLTESPRTLLWLAVVTAVAALAYLLSARQRASRCASAAD